MTEEIKHQISDVAARLYSFITSKERSNNLESIGVNLAAMITFIVEEGYSEDFYKFCGFTFPTIKPSPEVDKLELVKKYGLHIAANSHPNEIIFMLATCYVYCSSDHASLDGEYNEWCVALAAGNTDESMGLDGEFEMMS